MSNELKCLEKGEEIITKIKKSEMGRMNSPTGNAYPKERKIIT